MSIKRPEILKILNLELISWKEISSQDLKDLVNYIRELEVQLDINRVVVIQMLEAVNYLMEGGALESLSHASDSGDTWYEAVENMKKVFIK